MKTYVAEAYLAFALFHSSRWARRGGDLPLADTKKEKRSYSQLEKQPITRPPTSIVTNVGWPSPRAIAESVDRYHS